MWEEKNLAYNSPAAQQYVYIFNTLLPLAEKSKY